MFYWTIFNGNWFNEHVIWAKLLKMVEERSQSNQWNYKEHKNESYHVLEPHK